MSINLLSAGHRAHLRLLSARKLYQGAIAQASAKRLIRTLHLLDIAEERYRSALRRTPRP